MKISPSIKVLFLFIALSLVLAPTLIACEPKPEQTPGPASETQDLPSTEAPAATASPATERPKVLNVCIANEPASLYRYDGRNSLSKQSVFTALYGFHDGSTLLQSLPDISQETVSPEEGMPVLTADGTVQVLRKGTQVYATGQPEVTAWDTDLALDMQRSTIIYRLYDEQLWSDGTPLTAHDLLYTYHLLRRLELPAYQWALERTDKLEALDEQTLKWTGIPGFIASDPMAFFWQALPAHIFEILPDEDLLDHPMATLTPPGWGAWRITNWQKGAQLNFERNPNYIHVAAHQNGFEFLNFVIVPDAEEALTKLEQGECQILDKSYQLESLDDARLYELATKYQLVIEDFEPVGQLVFGIRPAGYDAGFDSAIASRQDYFGTPQVRQAIAGCLATFDIATSIFNRDWIAHSWQLGMDTEPFVPPAVWTDAKGRLTDLGWVIRDGSDGVRVADGVPNVEDGTPFSINLLTGQSAQSQSMANLIVQNLADCGIAVTHTSLPAEELYAPGPDGVLFGRQFDMALVNWGKLPFPLCELYTSGQIPGPSTHWIGTNIAGLNDNAFNYGCMNGNSDEMMIQYVPAVPLMPQIRVWLASPDLDLTELIRFDLLSELKPVVP